MIRRRDCAIPKLRHGTKGTVVNKGYFPTVATRTWSVKVINNSTAAVYKGQTKDVQQGECQVGQVE